MTVAPPVLGLDFGTTNTCAAWVDASGSRHVVRVNEASAALPSAVCLHDNEHPLVGQPARDTLAEHPQLTFVELKRFLGRTYASDFVGHHRERYQYRLTEGERGTCAVHVPGGAEQVEDVASLVVQRMVEIASASARETFQEAVLTFPCRFTFHQREALRSMATRAGLRVRAMMTEPVAVALSRAGVRARPTTLLVYDLGGGTLDTAIVRMEGGVATVLAQGGDAFLGGSNFDAAVVDVLCERFAETYDVDPRFSAVAALRIKHAVESAKIELSRREVAKVRVPAAVLRGESFVDFDFELTRAELEEIVAPLIARSREIALETVKAAGLSPSALDEVAVVGGQSKMPALRSSLATVFHNSRLDDDADVAVAVGAASLAAGSHVLRGVASSPIVLSVPHRAAQELVAKDEPLPMGRGVSLARPRPGAPLDLTVYEEVPRAAGNARQVIGSSRVDDDWLHNNPGGLQLRASVGSAFELSLSLTTSEGAALVLELDDDLRVAPMSRREKGVRLEDRAELSLPVLVRVGASAAFVATHTVDLSERSVFVAAEEPPRLFARVQLVLQAPDGPLTLSGIVVRCAPAGSARPGQGAGFAVRFDALSAADQARVVDLVTRAARETKELPEVAPHEPVDVLVKHLLAKDYYAALDVDALAPTGEVERRLGELRQMLDSEEEVTSGEALAQCQSARHLLRRAELKLSDPRERLVNDFERGEVRAAERLARAAEGGIFDPELCRVAWLRTNAAAVDRVNQYVIYASADELEGDLKQAVVEMQRAIDRDPFNLKLHERLASLRERAGL